MRKINKDVINYFIYCLLAISYFLACFLRTSSGVVLPNVSDSMVLTPSAMGLISGMFFYGYTVAQPFCGKMCDEKGPLLIESCGLILFALGLFLFAIARSTTSLCFARFLIGIGAGPTFCGVMVFQAKAFSPNIFSKLMGYTIMLGHFGGVVSITPLGSAVDKYGYRVIHSTLAVFVLLIACSLYYLRRNFTVSYAKAEKVGGVLSGFMIIYRSSKLRSVLFLWSLGMLLQMNLIGLWGVTWIATSGNIAVSSARFYMSMAGSGVLVGAFLCGRYGNDLVKSPKYIRWICLFLISILLSLTMCIDFCLAWPLVLSLSLCLGVILGMTNVLCNIYLYKIVGPDLVGTVTGANNVILFLAVLFSQWLSGVFIQEYNNLINITYVSSYAAFFLIISMLGVVALHVLFKTSFKDE